MPSVSYHPLRYVQGWHSTLLCLRHHTTVLSHWKGKWWSSLAGASRLFVGAAYVSNMHVKLDTRSQ